MSGSSVTSCRRLLDAMAPWRVTIMIRPVWVTTSSSLTDGTRVVALTTMALVSGVGLATVVSAVGAVIRTGPVVVKTRGRLSCSSPNGMPWELVSAARSRPVLRAWEKSTLYRWCMDLRVITGLTECMRLILIRANWLVVSRTVELLRPETTVEDPMTLLKVAAYYVSRSLLVMVLPGMLWPSRLVISLLRLVERNLCLRWVCLGSALNVRPLLHRVPRCLLIRPRLMALRPLFRGAAVSVMPNVATLPASRLRAPTTLLSPVGSIGYLLRGMNTRYRLVRPVIMSSVLRRPLIRVLMCSTDPVLPTRW